MIEVVVPCSCPGKPHEQDSVGLLPQMDVRIGSAAMAAMRAAPSSIPDLEGALAGAFLHFGVREWSLVDAEGEPLPLTIENIDERLSWANGGMEVAEKANELYAGDLFAPFARRAPKKVTKRKASRSGPTDNSTSATPESGSNTDSSDKPSLHAVSGGKPSEAKAS